MQQAEELKQIQYFTANNYGSVPEWAKLVFRHPRLGEVPGKSFLRKDLGLTGMEVSLNSLPAGESISFTHGHKLNEELYLFVSGNGQMLLDETVLEVRAGMAVRISPRVIRCWRNTGSEPLTCIVIQAQEGSLTQATENDGFIVSRTPPWPES